MVSVELKDSIKIGQESKSLFLTFDYNPEVVDSIKTLKTRYWHYNLKAWEVPQESIHDLIRIFGVESLHIDENVDLEYIKENVELNDNEKWTIFNPLLSKLPSDIAKFTIEVLDQVPDYFYNVAASSSGRYHPKYALGEGGLLRHTLAAGLIALELFNNETVCGEFNNREKGLMLSAIILHDTFKHGLTESNHTVAEHPLIAARFIRELKQDIISELDVKTIASCISTHMGEWNMDYKNKFEIMDKPKSNMQKFVHMCDYLASRKILEVNFDNYIK